MVTGFIDSNIIVDVLRKHAPAEAWLSQQSNLGLTRFVWIEVLYGAINRVEQQRCIRLLRDFEIIEIQNADVEWATQQSLALSLRYNIDPIDYLIAAPAHRLQLPLYTRNLKHFGPLLGGLAVLAY
ncbi:MAG: PIN domain-containing protein [Anaerolineae bacterium]